jgi:hypothetical protein
MMGASFMHSGRVPNTNAVLIKPEMPRVLVLAGLFASSCIEPWWTFRYHFRNNGTKTSNQTKPIHYSQREP